MNDVGNLKLIDERFPDKNTLKSFFHSLNSILYREIIDYRAYSIHCSIKKMSRVFVPIERSVSRFFSPEHKNSIH